MSPRVKLVIELTRWLSYVYSVFAGDYARFTEAIAKAVSTPIGRYIAPHMKREAFHQRLESLVNTDWKARVMDLGDEWRADAIALHEKEGKKLNIVSAIVEVVAQHGIANPHCHRGQDFTF